MTAKPTYYIWVTEEMKEEEVEQIKNYWILLGFRAVVFRDGNKNKDIHTGLKSVIQNHIFS